VWHIQVIPETVLPESIVGLSVEQTEQVHVDVLLRAVTDTHFKQFTKIFILDQSINSD